MISGINEEYGSHRVGVVQREQRVEDVLAGDREELGVSRLIDIAGEVRVGEYDPLLMASGPAGVKYRGDVLTAGKLRGFDRSASSGDLRESGASFIAIGIKVDDDVLRAGPGSAREFLDHITVGEDALCPAKRAERLDLSGRHLVVKRNDRGFTEEDAQIGDRPLRRVLAVEDDAITLADALRQEVGRHIEDTLVDLLVSERYLFASLDDGEGFAPGVLFHRDEEHMGDRRPVSLEQCSPVGFQDIPCSCHTVFSSRFSS